MKKTPSPPFLQPLSTPLPLGQLPPYPLLFHVHPFHVFQPYWSFVFFFSSEEERKNAQEEGNIFVSHWIAKIQAHWEEVLFMSPPLLANAQHIRDLIERSCQKYFFETTFFDKREKALFLTYTGGFLHDAVDF